MKAPDYVIGELLDRLVAIEKTITATDSAGNVRSLAAAYPRQFEPIDQLPFPCALNWVSGWRPLRQSGAQVVQIDVLCTMRLAGGSAASGYQGANEDLVNLFSLPFYMAFENRPHLNSPVDGTAFQYLRPPSLSEPQGSAAGLVGFVVTDPNAPIFSMDFQLKVSLLIPKERVS